VEQTTLNRGHLAFLEDQVHAAVDAFCAGQLADVTPILESVSGYIAKFLLEANQRKQ
jgi:hypothetical protein